MNFFWYFRIHLMVQSVELNKIWTKKFFPNWKSSRIGFHLQCFEYICFDIWNLLIRQIQLIGFQPHNLYAFMKSNKSIVYSVTGYKIQLKFIDWHIDDKQWMLRCNCFVWLNRKAHKTIRFNCNHEFTCEPGLNEFLRSIGSGEGTIGNNCRN